MRSTSHSLEEASASISATTYDKAARHDADTEMISKILDASERLVAAHSLEAVIDVLRDTARAAVGAEGIAVAVKVGGRCCYISEDAVAPLWQGQSFPIEECVSGWAIRERQTVAIRDVRLDDRVPQNAYAQTFVRSLIMVPIGRPEPVAALGAYWSVPQDHSAETVARLEGLARLATIAIENARLAQERERAEGDLRDSEERLRLAVENADVGFWDVDVLHDQLIWPPRTKAMFGISPDVPVTIADFYEGVHPGDREATLNAYFAAADPERRALYDVEYRTVGKEDGVERWVAAKGRGVFDASGRCIRIAGTVLDITARKVTDVRRSALADLTQAIKDLKSPADIAAAASEVLGRTLGSSRVGYAAIDHDAETLHVDRDWTAPGVDSLAGVLALRDYGSFIDSLKRGEFTVIDDVRLDERTAGAADALEGKRSRAFVNAPVLEHGRLVTVFFVNHDAPRNWSDGDLALINDFADRTRNAVERARGEYALRESERRLRALNETLEAQVEARSAERDRLWNLSQDMLARADYRGRMSAVSPAWSLVLGWSEDELLSRDYATFMHPDDAPPTLEAIGRMSSTGLPTRFENRISTRDGEWKSIEWTVAPEPDGLNFIAVGRDLTHAKTREADLANAQEALRQSQKMEAMGSLTGGVAHDFNNLLTPIIGSLDMLVRKNVGSERERRLIDGALQSAERAKTLVQRLLAFARRQPLQPTSVDVARLVNGLVELLGSTLGPTVDLRLDLALDLPPAKADPNQLEMALLNLAVNARDAMPEGGALTIEASRETLQADHSSGLTQGPYVRLAVRDSGIGMDAETVSRATEPFFSTKGVGKGTGLGLSMVHGLAAQLGGGLTIESAVGTGTTVALWLPLSAVAEEEERRGYETCPVETGRGVALLVDDEELVRMSTADMLMDLGYDVREARSAEEALSLLDSGLKPDVVVTDHLMPAMSGAAFARQLRTSRPELPVLIVSGYAEVDGVDPDLARLTKPFRNAELAASLATLLPHAKSH
ncbi:PAS domain S-box-containing protein [Sphingomonas trueperi]|uniref:PAS domain-containing protein n=1 Tax=Sphingomonas trueperi TaxID=53317 RepID=UPI0033998EE8